MVFGHGRKNPAAVPIHRRRTRSLETSTPEKQGLKAAMHPQPQGGFDRLSPFGWEKTGGIPTQGSRISDRKKSPLKFLESRRRDSKPPRTAFREMNVFEGKPATDLAPYQAPNIHRGRQPLF
jgi:hypothetical protein